MLRLLFCLMVFLIPQALAHSVPVNLKASLESTRLVLEMRTLDGWPINGAKIEGMLLQENGTTVRLPLEEFGSQGTYGSPNPRVKAGTYTLLFRDTTFESESLEVQQRVQWPLVQPVELLLPASKAGSADWPVVLVLTAMPVLVALAVLVFVVLRHPKPKPETGPG